MYTQIITKKVLLFFVQYKNEWKGVSTDEMDVNNILISKKEPYGTKNSLK